MPKNTAIAQPSRVRATSANRTAGPTRGAASGWSWPARPIQGPIASSASAAQMARPMRQLPVASEMGTVSTPAVVRATAMAVV